ncbi:MAG: hypothetical protein ACE5G8_08720 [Anaerolineae bacterium]
MNCCQCQGIETCFNQTTAARDLKRYRQKGPAKTTRFLLDALKTLGVQGLTLLDVGGGVGAIQHQLLPAGVTRAAHVDAASAYLHASQEEAARLGHADRVAYHYGNFVDLAPTLSPADIVTLDRVICCYHDMPALVSGSVGLARRYYALVYPRDTWWLKAGFAAGNRLLSLRGNPFRVFAHPTRAVEAIIAGHGFTRRMYRQFLFWQVAIYCRQPPEEG